MSVPGSVAFLTRVSTSSTSMPCAGCTANMTRIPAASTPIHRRWCICIMCPPLRAGILCEAPTCASAPGAVTRGRSAGDGVRLGQPGCDRRIGGHAPVAARRQRPTRADLRRVRHAIALELICEEALEEEHEALADRRERIAVAERVHGEARDAAWAEAEAQEPVEEEVVQL